MQIKTTIRYHFTPVRMAIIKKNTNNKCGEDVEKGNPCTLLAGMLIGITTVENSREGPQKNKNKTTI